MSKQPPPLTDEQRERLLREAAILRVAADPDPDGQDDATPGELGRLRAIAARLEALATAEPGKL